MKKSYYLLALSLALAFFTSCEVTEPGPVADQVAPTIPPAEMYTVPIQSLTDTEEDTTVQNTTNNISYRNWGFSAINLLVWNTAIVANVGIPIASFQRALNERPVYIGNATFEWSYVYQAPPALGGGSYDVVLTGRYINNGQEVEWIMKLSKAGGFTDFEWFSGIVATDFSEANFTLNHKPNNPEPYIDIDYDRNSSNGDQSIRYTNINPSSNGIGGYIEYGEVSTQPYNRAFEVSAGPTNPNNVIEIEWLVPSGEGRVRNQPHFNDNNWHCWDTRLRDAPC